MLKFDHLPEFSLFVRSVVLVHLGTHIEMVIITLNYYRSCHAFYHSRHALVASFYDQNTDEMHTEYEQAA